MKHSAKADTTVEDALEARTFDSLSIKRIGRECHLVVTVAGTTRVLADRRGQPKSFRHAWQIREWLQSEFQIVADSIPVETYR
jgi:hypothetical protein